MRAMVFGLCLIATPAAAADPFDLICKGTERVGHSKAFETRYRVDLDRMLFCRDECTSTRPIASVNGGRIEFQKADQSEIAAGIRIVHYVDRTNGSWISFLSGAFGVLEDAEGKCEPAPFSGFPATKF